MFVLKILNQKYLWGIVANTNIQFGSTNMLHHIQFFSLETDSIENMTDFSSVRLLVPPIITNELAWKKGYFMNVGKLENVESLPSVQNASFYSALKNKIFNDNQEEILFNNHFDSLGEHTLISYLEIDNRISHTLEIPLAVAFIKGNYNPFWYLEKVKGVKH